MYISKEYKTWYSKNYDLKIKRVTKRLESIKLWYRNLKTSSQCTTCGAKCTEKLLKRFDFHHKDPETKELCIADAVGRGLSVEKIKLELEKCEFLCKTCHQSI